MTENAWLVTFVIEVVTAIGASIYVFANEQFVVPSLEILGYMAFIGVLSNGIGFWAFLKASQESARLPETKTIFLALMCLTPLVQVILLPILGVEVVGGARWFGSLLVTAALVFHRLYPAREKVPALS